MRRTSWVAWLAGAWMLAAVDSVAAQEGTPADSGAGAPSTFEEAAGRIEGMTEQLQAPQSETDKLGRFKFSGYVQARYEMAELSDDSVKVERSPSVLTPANLDRFYIRRGRLKLTYDSSPLSQAVVYIDGGADRTVRLLEAYVTLLDPWTTLHQHQLTVGQFNVPFGYEIERSSSVRELPERSRAQNLLFSGERDRGIKLVNLWTSKLETVVAVLNGGGVNHPEFPTTDPTGSKDALGRVRWSQGWLDGAASYYSGEAVTPLTGPDVETHKTRLGFDAQLYYEMPTLGGGSFKGEYYGGRNLNPDSVRALVVAPTTANPVTLLRAGADPGHLATPFTGGYAMWVQNLGEVFQLASRFEIFDPNTDLENDQFERVSLGLNWFYDGYTRVTVAYDIPRTEVANPSGGTRDPDDDLWTIQFQMKF